MDKGIIEINSSAHLMLNRDTSIHQLRLSVFMAGKIDATTANTFELAGGSFMQIKDSSTIINDNVTIYASSGANIVSVGTFDKAAINAKLTNPNVQAAMTDQSFNHNAGTFAIDQSINAATANLNIGVGTAATAVIGADYTIKNALRFGATQSIGGRRL